MKIFDMNRHILKRYAKTKDTIDRQYTERGAAIVSTFISNIRIKSLSYGDALKSCLIVLSIVFFFFNF